MLKVSVDVESQVLLVISGWNLLIKIPNDIYNLNTSSPSFLKETCGVEGKCSMCNGNNEC